MDNKQPRLDSWDDFAGEYLKAEFVKGGDKAVVTEVETYFDENRAKLIAIVELNKRAWKFDLNKSNQNFIKTYGVKSPKQLIGKTLTLAKTKVRNPSTGLQVDSLLITALE